MPRVAKKNNHFSPRRGKIYFKRNKKTNKNNKADKTEFDKKRKNFKFIKRSKEAEELQRRQKIIEDKYKKNNAVESMSESDEDNTTLESPLEQLISTFKGTHEHTADTKYKAIESSSDEDENENEEEQESVEDEDSVEDKNSFDGESENASDALSEETDENEVEDDEELNSDSEDPINDNNETAVVAEIDVPAVYDESSEDEELDEETETNDCEQVNELDPFSRHLENDLSENHIENLFKKPPVTKKSQLNWPSLGNLSIEIIHSSAKPTETIKSNKKKIKILLDDQDKFAKEGVDPEFISKDKFDLKKLYIKQQLITKIEEIINAKSETILNSFQCEIFSILNNYQDLFYPQRNFDNAEDIRFVYCLHAVNHMLKTRTKVLHHNAKLSTTKTPAIIPDSYRDQGLTRPKILIILPFRNSAFSVINNFITLLFGKKAETAKSDGSVINYKRFMEEYTGDTIRFPKTNPKPDDYEKLFSGNTDDTFRIGISFTKKCMKLFTEFYSSDILVASPLGLRMIVGAAGDKERDYDFLNSIELLILDQAELFLAQNWDHLIHVLDHLHLQPQSVKNTDFSRVRSWCVNGFSKYYRQTLLFTSHELPEFRSLFNNKCCNYRGKVKICNPQTRGTIQNATTSVAQVFYNVPVTSIQSSYDTRFKYFITEILPQFKSPSMAHCMLYVPSYFDYVRLRNYFKTESLNFVQICEYTKDGKIARARDMFFHSSAHFLLYSERAHFFRRTRIKGIRHLIMYQPPTWPHFYSEMINLMQDGYQNPRDGLNTSMSVTILYSKYDLLQMQSIMGTERTKEMIESGKSTHMFTTMR